LNWDSAISIALNSIVGHSTTISDLLLWLNGVCGAVFVAGIWYLWIKQPGARDRVQLLFGVAVAIAVALVARAIQFSLPFHLRPLYTPQLHLSWAHGIAPDSLHAWSSMPSDHSTICFALATVIALRDRRAGATALLWALVQTVARVSLGFHFASDVTVGALLGIVAIVATHHLRVPAGIVAILARTIDKPWAAFCLFLTSWELSNFYQSAQRLIEIIQKAI
jgi:membrane-associated phospholipid phosphatase